LADEEYQYADALAEFGERQRDAGHDAGVAPHPLPRPARLRDIVVDAGPLGPERLPAYAAAIDIVRIGREAGLRDQIERLAGPRDRLKPMRIRFGQEHDGGEGLAPVHGPSQTR